LRILMVGDDVMAAAGPAARAKLEGTGRAIVTVDAAAGAGLASAEDWVVRVAHDLDRTSATVVVIHFGGRDAAPFASGPDGAQMEPGSGPWFDRWSRQEHALATMLRARDVKTYWLSTPPVADPVADQRAEVVGLLAESLFRAFADSIAHIDVRDRFVGSDGHFAATRVEAGRTLELRSADGYGLGVDGAQVMGDEIFRRVDDQWCLTAAVTCHVEFSSVPRLDTGRPTSRRVLVVGDSMMWQLAPALSARLRDVGVDVRIDTRSTTSLVGPFDWQGRLVGLVDSYHPDLVVGLFLGDLAPGYTDANGVTVELDSQYHYDLLGTAINEATAHLRARGAHVVWVAGPRAASPATEQRLDVLQALYEGVSDRSPRSVSTLDGFAALSDATGEYAFSLPDAAGRPVPMRLPDGLHLSGAGIDRLTDAIVNAVRADPCIVRFGGCDRG